MNTIRTRLTALATAGVLSAVGLGTLATTANAQTVPQCGNSSLAVTRTFTDSGAGHTWMSLVYRNTSNETCTVTGYPGLDAINRHGDVLAHAARTPDGYGGGVHGNGVPKKVTILPGGYASASVEWLNFNGSTGGSCRFSAAVNTIVANTSQVHRLPVSVSICSLEVHPTVAGTPLYPHYGPAQLYWIKGSKVDAADQNKYLISARQELKTAKGYYPTQVQQLTQLISLPDTGLTPKQIKEARSDTRSLNSFFATPGLYL